MDRWQVMTDMEVNAGASPSTSPSAIPSAQPSYLSAGKTHKRTLAHRIARPVSSILQVGFPF